MVARQLCRRSVLATDAGRRADKIMCQTLMGEPPKPSRTSRWSVGMSRASRSATPTSSRALTHGSAEVLCRRTPNELAFCPAHVQVDSWLLPKELPLELRRTALEPRRASGQRRSGASAQRRRGAHSVRPAGGRGRFCSISAVRSYFP
jgi:hypothetical protein